MLAASTELKNAQKVKEFILKHGLFNQKYLPIKELDHIYFPLIKKASIPLANVINTRLNFPEKKTKIDLKDILKDKLTATELQAIPRSQEIVGEIMILEVPAGLEIKEKIIAEAYLQFNKNVTTVVKKEAIHSGIFRLRKVKILAGKKTKETIHQENGIKIKLNLEKTYFSARSGNERLRIAKLIKKEELVLVMFSGAGPYPLVIAKKSPAKMVYGVEMNPNAHQYALESIELNNLEKKIKLFQGDVRKILPNIKKKFNRIVMPLPKTSEEFLDIALTKIKKNGIIHLYAFLSEEEFNSEAKKIKQICKNNKQQVKVLRKVKCGQFSPKIFRVCFDLTVIGKFSQKIEKR